MDFSWPNAYDDYNKKLIQFAQDELNKELVSLEEAGEFPRELWQKCADFGIQGLSVSKAYGGSSEEVDFLGAMCAMEAFGYGCIDNGLAFGLNAQMWTVQTPILHFGSEDQKNKYLKGCVSGELIGAHALTEPEAGSDIFSMQLLAEKVDGGYKLNGKKALITLAPVADFVLVFATTNPKLGKWGISAFLVDSGKEGFVQSDRKKKMGLSTIPIGELDFKDCFIPDDALLGKEGLGFSILNNSLEYDRCCILASQLGAMERQIENTISFSKSRKQFGKSINNFQSVSNRIVDMKLRLETSRLLLYKTAWLKNQGKSAMMEAALLKLQLSESFVSSSIDAMRTFGGKSYLVENGIEKDLRDSIGGILYAGTSDIQRSIIAKFLGL
jgi:alkylation response protein AidB-like acyl-CoA dehydrogenase